MTYGMAPASTDPRTALPAPGWSPRTADYWRAAGQGSLTVPRCSECGTHRWPPVVVCYRCLSTSWRWEPVPGTGRVFTYFWVDQPPHRSLAEHGLYNVTIVELDGTQGEPVRLAGWVVGVDKDTLHVDLPVEVTFEPFEGDDEIAVPVWRPRAAGAGSGNS